MGRAARIHRQVALPTEHGTWALLLAPFAIGLIAGGGASVATLYLAVVLLCGFLVRQPVTMLVKVRSGRRSADYRGPALFWTAVYTVVGLLHVYGLVLRGHAYLLWLAFPGLIVLAWHLALIARRSERRQLGVELVGAAYLALAAPAAFWVARDKPDLHGLAVYTFVLAWNLWAVLQTYLRLGQRTATAPMPRATWLAPLAVAAVPLALGALTDLSFHHPPSFVPEVFVLPFLATLYAWRFPATGWRPRRIGFEMLAITVAFTALFAGLWAAGMPVNE